MRRTNVQRRSVRRLVGLMLATLVVLVPVTGGGVAAAAASAAGVPAPVVLFPGFHLGKLRVEVRDQHTDPACPASGTFEDWSGNPARSAFSQVCRDELMTLRQDRRAGVAWADRFSEQPGVTVTLPEYGQPDSAPFYEPMFTRLQAAGLVRDRTLRVADYDSRLTPDLGGFLARTTRLIEQTARAAGGRPVQLVGHSNGPLYAQYLLTHTSAAWKARYVHGFTPIAGNFPGQGLLYPLLFTGLNTQDFTLPTTRANARSSARMYLSAPSSYMSAATPQAFGRSEVVVRDDSTGRSYTPADYPQLLRDAGLPAALELAQHYIGLVRYAPVAWFPDVDVTAERGSGIATAVGFALRDLTVGQLLTAHSEVFTRDGDVNQEDTTNIAVLAWQGMRCFRFRLTDNPGVDHFSLPSDPAVLDRLVSELRRPRSACQ